MNIVTIGAGFVGSTHSAVLASFGHRVLAYDLNKERIADLASRVPERIDACIYEPGLSNLIKTHENLQFTADLTELYALSDTIDVIFLCLPTPAHELTLPDEQQHLFIAAKTIAVIIKKRNNGEQTKRIVIVNKSTVPIGTAEKLKIKFTEWGV
ncbi:hypothetical protein J4211_02910, partial [Candidatus Woesearchaeota archaeon]|nr:hypothetical protein [Candidatus Woesearchaeota archaeon]